MTLCNAASFVPGTVHYKAKPKNQQVKEIVVHNLPRLLFINDSLILEGNSK